MTGLGTLALFLLAVLAGIGVGAMLLGLALVGLLGVARANGQLPGVPLLALGLLANLLVLVLNLGVPVSVETLDHAGVAVEQPVPHRPDAKHVIDDRLAVRPLRTAASFGDVAELAGLFLLVQWLVIGSARREEDAAHGSPKARTVPWSTWAD